MTPAKTRRKPLCGFRVVKCGQVDEERLINRWVELIQCCIVNPEIRRLEAEEEAASARAEAEFAKLGI